MIHTGRMSQGKRCSAIPRRGGGGGGEGRQHAVAADTASAADAVAEPEPVYLPPRG